ncbi:MAG: type II toxin-antitoxin system PemK/MazF family toxin [Calothrix sp. SM1_7_51]|nr:type II toxin-antitoxin system PemK/MazF family toxin [Calothrix sp. SM1_7_51]
MNFRRGDVVLCRIPMPSTQLQHFKIRPGVIISANELNDIVDDVMVVPCTSNTKRFLTATQYLIRDEEMIRAGIRVESVVRCESIFTLNKLMIIRTLGFLTPEAMSELNNCLIVALQL